MCMYIKPTEIHVLYKYPSDIHRAHGFLYRLAFLISTYGYKYMIYPSPIRILIHHSYTFKFCSFTYLNPLSYLFQLPQLSFEINLEALIVDMHCSMRESTGEKSKGKMHVPLSECREDAVDCDRKPGV